MTTVEVHVQAAWQALLATAVETPGLRGEFERRRPELFPRFAIAYLQLQAVPRRVRRGLQRQWRLPLASLALWLALTATPVQAATITVGGACALVEAITAANTDTATGGCRAGRGPDTIVLPTGSLQKLTQANNSTHGPTGLPVIRSVITIVGNGSTIARVRGGPFWILAVNSTGQLTLQETTVSGGKTPPPSPPLFSQFAGGGVANYGGTVTVLNSTISGNTASGNSPANRGGEVANHGAGIVTVTNSTISGNTAYIGGGVVNYGPLTVTNSTISGNSAYDGGGVVNVPTATVTVINSTISGNTAFGGGNPAGGVTNYGLLTLVRTLISGNMAVTGLEIRIACLTGYGCGFVVADNHNLFGVDGVAGVEGFTPGLTDIVPPVGVLLADILEPTLADNGGPTQTHALVPGSPAVDAGGSACLDVNGNSLTTDQRGEPRPVDGDGDGVVACDIGAFEVQP